MQTVESSPEGVFNLSIVIPLHHDSAHHVQQIGKLQKAGHIWVDLNGQVLNERI